MMIKKKLNSLNISSKNVYNMNETRVLLSVLSFLKILINKNDLRKHKAIAIKRILIIVIECIFTNDRYLHSLTI